MRFWIAVSLMCVFGQAAAQAERHGLRIHYTSIASNGGLEGRAFVPVSSRSVEVPAAADAACKVRYVTIRGSVRRGPLRELVLRAPAKKAGRVALATSPCDGASIEAQLEDGSQLRGGRGYVEVQSEPSPADPTWRGVFAQTTERQGAPVTIEGSFVVPAGKATGTQ